MNSECDSKSAGENTNLHLFLEPDILDLGKYLAKKYGVSLETFLEVLITDHASKSKSGAALGAEHMQSRF